MIEKLPDRFKVESCMAEMTLWIKLNEIIDAVNKQEARHIQQVRLIDSLIKQIENVQALVEDDTPKPEGQDTCGEPNCPFCVGEPKGWIKEFDKKFFPKNEDGTYQYIDIRDEEVEKMRNAMVNFIHRRLG